MEVILLEKHNKLGEIGTVINVKNGYARNYLIPNKKALVSTPENVKFFENRRADIEKEFQSKKAQAEKLKSAIDNKHIVLIKQAGEDSRLYGSVNSTEISKSIAEQLSQEVHKSCVNLISQIKYLGIHYVTLNIFSDVTTQLKIVIGRSTEEAAKTLKEDQELLQKKNSKKSAKSDTPNTYDTDTSQNESEDDESEPNESDESNDVANLDKD